MLDPAAGKVYRPGAATIDVVVNGFVVPTVSVTPVGFVPSVGQPVDLAAPATSGPGSASGSDPHTAVFDYPQGADIADPSGNPQPMSVAVNGLYSYPGGTMLVWTVTAQAAGAGLGAAGLPVADYDLHTVGTGLKTTVSDGPGLVPAAADPRTAVTMRSDYATLRQNTGKEPFARTAHWQECLCSDWQEREEALKPAGGSVTLATEYPELPAGTTSADVTFPGSTAAALSGVPVTPLPATTSGRAQPAPPTTWHADEETLFEHPFAADQWPSPVPDAASYTGFSTRIIDDLVRKTTAPASRSDTQSHVTNLSLKSTVLFAVNSATLLPAAAAALHQVAGQLNAAAKAGSTVTVTGYVSANDGQTVAAGQALSTARAKAVHSVLKGAVTVVVHWSVLGKGAQDRSCPTTTRPTGSSTAGSPSPTPAHDRPRRDRLQPDGRPHAAGARASLLQTEVVLRRLVASTRPPACRGSRSNLTRLPPPHWSVDCPLFSRRGNGVVGGQPGLTVLGRVPENRMRHNRTRCLRVPVDG